MSERRPFTITCVERIPAGYWRAHVSCDGKTIEVDNRYGSWHAVVRSGYRKRSFKRRDVLPDVAAALQERIKKEQRRMVAA